MGALWPVAAKCLPWNVFDNCFPSVVRHTLKVPSDKVQRKKREGAGAAVDSLAQMPGMNFQTRSRSRHKQR